MSDVKKYDLNELEAEYRRFTTNGDPEAVAKMKSILAVVRYDLSNESVVHMEYRDGLPEPILMRILRNEKDLDRWVEQRFIRLGEL